MHFKGLNSKVPCRCCTQPAVLCKSNKHYYLVSAIRGVNCVIGDYTDLPVRDEVETKLTGAWLGATAPCPAREEVENTAGINDEVSCFEPCQPYMCSV